jgi:ureidoacrylate peracid hydrolase
MKGAATMAADHRVVRIEANPEPIKIDTAKTAVLVVDMQNDFAARGGMFDRAGIDIGIIRTVVEPTAMVLSAARRAHIPIIYIKMQHQLHKDAASTGPLGCRSCRRHLIKHQQFSVGAKVKAPDGGDSRVLVKDTWDTQIIGELAPREGDLVIPKHRYSSFYQTSLDDVLKARGVKHLVVTGCTTSVCVESTVRDAMFRDYFCVVLADCTAEPLGHHNASLLLIEKLFGWVSGSREFISAVDGL